PLERIQDERLSLVEPALRRQCLPQQCRGVVPHPGEPIAVRKSAPADGQTLTRNRLRLDGGVRARALQERPNLHLQQRCGRERIVAVEQSRLLQGRKRLILSACATQHVSQLPFALERSTSTSQIRASGVNLASCVLYCLLEVARAPQYLCEVP